MAPANNGLISVIGVQVQTTADEEASQDIARRGNALPCLAADCDREVDFCHTESPFWLFELYPTLST